MPETVRAKFLLGWMSQHEAVNALNECVFDPPLTQRKAIALWRQYRDRVEALPVRNIVAPPALPLTPEEQEAANQQIARINATGNAVYHPEVIKVDTRELVARQFHVITERAEDYAKQMQAEADRINCLFGVGLDMKCAPVARRVSRTRVVVDLPHDEFIPQFTPQGINFQERPRYASVIRGGNRLILWSGYHRNYSVLSQLGPDGAGVPPLLTVMTGMPEAEDFLAGRALLAVRNIVLGDRAPLLRDFFNDDLCISVDLRKKRVEARIDQIRPNKTKVSIVKVNV